jgi:hypothetical protein
VINYALGALACCAAFAALVWPFGGTTDADADAVGMEELVRKP